MGFRSDLLMNTGLPSAGFNYELKYNPHISSSQIPISKSTFNAYLVSPFRNINVNFIE